MNDTKTTRRRRRTNPAERLEDIAALLGKLNADALYRLGREFATKHPIGGDILRRGLDEGGSLKIPLPTTPKVTIDGVAAEAWTQATGLALESRSRAIADPD